MVCDPVVCLLPSSQASLSAEKEAWLLGLVDALQLAIEGVSRLKHA